MQKGVLSTGRERRGMSCTDVTVGIWGSGGGAVSKENAEEKKIRAKQQEQTKPNRVFT